MKTGTKKIMIVAGLAVAGYLLYDQYKKNKAAEEAAKKAAETALNPPMGVLERPADKSPTDKLHLNPGKTNIVVGDHTGEQLTAPARPINSIAVGEFNPSGSVEALYGSFSGYPKGGGKQMGPVDIGW